MGKHKEWRKQAKKYRRKHIRQQLAAQRDKKLKEEEEQLLKDPNYQTWLEQQKYLEKLQVEIEQKQHDEEEEKWLRRELLSQKLFREQQKRRQEIEIIKEQERLRIQKEFEKQQMLVKQKQEEKKRLADERKMKHEKLLQNIKEYIEEGNEMPEEFRETADTNPGKEICPFFSKTASCRFGDKCSRNHSRPGISKILLLPHFFNHIRLEQSKNTEYGNDFALEYSDLELYRDYGVFFEDVVPEMEKFGMLKNFRTCNNCEPHLRGNVYVEYAQERDALKAFMTLQGRYYAGKRINVEFAKIPSWKAAVCGLSLSRRCPKGKSCNFLHIFKNPLNKYNTTLSSVTSCSSERTDSNKEPFVSRSPGWDKFEDDKLQKRNWRWSETPERSFRQDKCTSTSRASSKKRSRSRSRSDFTKRSRSRTYNKKRSRSRSDSKKRNRLNSTSKERSRSISKSKRLKNRSSLELADECKRVLKHDSTSRSRSRDLKLSSRDKNSKNRDRNESLDKNNVDSSNDLRSRKKNRSVSNDREYNSRKDKSRSNKSPKNSSPSSKTKLRRRKKKHKHKN